MSEERDPQVQVENAEKVVTEARAEDADTDEAKDEHEPTDTAADEEPMDTGRLHE